MFDCLRLQRLKVLINDHNFTNKDIILQCCQFTFESQMTELLSLLLLISCQNCTFAYQLHLFLKRKLVLKIVISKLKQFMPVLRKPGSHKTAFRQTNERYTLRFIAIQFMTHCPPTVQWRFVRILSLIHI